jgi:hypothetical protein
MGEQQSIIIYVNEKGIIENLKDDINRENLTIKINITQEVKEIVEERNIKIAFDDNFPRKNLRLKNLGFIDNVGVQIIRNHFLSFCPSLINIGLSGRKTI